MKPLVKFVITDVNMGMEHSGLTEVIAIHKRKNKLFADSIRVNGGLILFINKPRNAAKLYSDSGHVLGYLRMPGKLTEKNIDTIPATFGGSVEYSNAVKSAFKKFLELDKVTKIKEEKTSLLA